jgi:hypothetical protein
MLRQQEVPSHCITVARPFPCACTEIRKAFGLCLQTDDRFPCCFFPVAPPPLPRWTSFPQLPTISHCLLLLVLVRPPSRCALIPRHPAHACVCAHVHEHVCANHPCIPVVDTCAQGHVPTARRKVVHIHHLLKNSAAQEVAVG